MRGRTMLLLLPWAVIAGSASGQSPRVVQVGDRVRFDFTLSSGTVAERGGEVLRITSDSVRVGTGGGFAPRFPRARIGRVEVGHKSIWRLGAFSAVGAGALGLIAASAPGGETCTTPVLGSRECRSTDRSVWVFGALGAALGVVLHTAEDSSWLTWEPAVLAGAGGSRIGLRLPVGGRARTAR